MSTSVLTDNVVSKSDTTTPPHEETAQDQEGSNSDLENRPAGGDYEADMVLDMSHMSNQKDASLTLTSAQEPLKSVKFNSSERWSTVNVRVSFDVTRKGERSLVIDGFKFTKSRDGMADRVFWRCSRRECKATAVTVMNKVEHVRAIHEHAPPMASEFFGGTPAMGDVQEVRFNTTPGNSGTGKRRRRRNSTLTESDKSSLSQIKEDLNETESVMSTPLLKRGSQQAWRQNVSPSLAQPDFNDSCNGDILDSSTKCRFGSGNEAMFSPYNSSPHSGTLDGAAQQRSLSDCLSRSLPTTMLAALTHNRVDANILHNMAQTVASHPLNLESSRRFETPCGQQSDQTASPLSDPALSSSSGLAGVAPGGLPFSSQLDSSSQNLLTNSMSNRQQLEQMALQFLKNTKLNYPINPNGSTPSSIPGNSPWSSSNWPSPLLNNPVSNSVSAFSACSPSYSALSPMLTRRRNDSLGSSGEFTPRTSPRSTPLGQDNRSTSSGAAVTNNSFLHWKKEKIKESEQEEHNQEQQRQRKRRHSESSPTSSVSMSACDRLWERVSGPLVHKLIEVVQHVGCGVTISQPLDELQRSCTIIQHCVKTMEVIKRLKLCDSAAEH